MNAIGELTAAVMDIGTKDTILQFRIHGDCRYDADKLKAKELDIKVRPNYKKRSLSMNSMYWSLIGNIAQRLEISNQRCHNLMLRRYGTLETVEDNKVYVVVPDDNEEQILEAETYHLQPTSQVKTGKSGKLFRTYMLIRGSSQYNTEEMMKLLDGAVSEAREMGIEIYDSDLERIKSQYEKGINNSKEE